MSAVAALRDLCRLRVLCSSSSSSTSSSMSSDDDTSAFASPPLSRLSAPDGRSKSVAAASRKEYGVKSGAQKTFAASTRRRADSGGGDCHGAFTSLPPPLAAAVSPSTPASPHVSERLLSDSAWPTRQTSFLMGTAPGAETRGENKRRGGSARAKRGPESAGAGARRAPSAKPTARKRKAAELSAAASGSPLLQLRIDTPLRASGSKAAERDADITDVFLGGAAAPSASPDEVGVGDTADADGGRRLQSLRRAIHALDVDSHRLAVQRRELHRRLIGLEQQHRPPRPIPVEPVAAEQPVAEAIAAGSTEGVAEIDERQTPLVAADNAAAQVVAASAPSPTATVVAASRWPCQAACNGLRWSRHSLHACRRAASVASVAIATQARVDGALPARAASFPSPSPALTSSPLCGCGGFSWWYLSSHFPMPELPFVPFLASMFLNNKIVRRARAAASHPTLSCDAADASNGTVTVTTEVKREVVVPVSVEPTDAAVASSPVAACPLPSQTVTEPGSAATEDVEAPRPHIPSPPLPAASTAATPTAAVQSFPPPCSPLLAAVHTPGDDSLPSRSPSPAASTPMECTAAFDLSPVPAADVQNPPAALTAAVGDSLDCRAIDAAEDEQPAQQPPTTVQHPAQARLESDEDGEVEVLSFTWREPSVVETLPASPQRLSQGGSQTTSPSPAATAPSLSCRAQALVRPPPVVALWEEQPQTIDCTSAASSLRLRNASPAATVVVRSHSTPLRAPKAHAISSGGLMVLSPESRTASSPLKPPSRARSAVRSPLAPLPCSPRLNENVQCTAVLAPVSVAVASSVEVNGGGGGRHWSVGVRSQYPSKVNDAPLHSRVASAAGTVSKAVSSSSSSTAFSSHAAARPSEQRPPSTARVAGSSDAVTRPAAAAFPASAPRPVPVERPSTLNHNAAASNRRAPAETAMRQAASSASTTSIPLSSAMTTLSFAALCTAFADSFPPPPNSGLPVPVPLFTGCAALDLQRWMKECGLKANKSHAFMADKLLACFTQMQRQQLTQPPTAKKKEQQRPSQDSGSLSQPVAAASQSLSSSSAPMASAPMASALPSSAAAAVPGSLGAVPLPAELVRRLRAFLRSAPSVYLQLLLLQPLDLQSLFLCMQGAGMECSKDQLAQFLDAEGCSFAQTPIGLNRSRHRSTGQKASAPAAASG